ncbi:glycosyltransferase [Psychromonas antarctica]|uniref:glycosyltransferase n=1 Tax=Psychromonas antarctica TaxID=67573 RepID=UPI001EE8A864|nr:glycosyltransferase [Psychromonas antarctica]MCG6201301.1 glycosyltransferase [Psychromonas antarctica]
MKIKVLIVISNMEFGGAQRQIVELVNNVDQEKFEIHVCSLSEYAPLAEQFNDGVYFSIVDKKKKFDFSVVTQLSHMIKKYSIDIIHSYLFDAEIACRLAAFISFSGVKVIGSERNTNYNLRIHQKIAIALTKYFVDIIIANSTTGAIFNSKLSRLTIDKYRVIYNGVNTEKFTLKNKNETKKNLNLPLNNQIIGMFASFKNQKNHPLLLQAFSEILPKHPNTTLLLVGDKLHGGMHGSDDYNRLIHNMITDLNLHDNCVCLGNRVDVENIYPACDFTVLPSLYEGTPNVLLESMACGKPVIATDVSDNAKIITNNINGLLIESENKAQLKNALIIMLDEHNIEKMTTEARSSIMNRFSSKILATNTQNVYIEALKG